MEPSEILTYNGYLVTALAISHQDGGGWDAAVSIAAVKTDEEPNLAPNNFYEFCNPLSSREDAIAAGRAYAKRLIDREILGLHI